MLAWPVGKLRRFIPSLVMLSHLEKDAARARSGVFAARPGRAGLRRGRPQGRPLRGSHARRDRAPRLRCGTGRRGEPMNALWRARLEGASVVRVGLQAIELAREGRSVVAGSIGAGKGAALRIAEGALTDADAAPRSELERRGALIADELANLATGGRREALRRALRRAIAKLERRVAAVEADLARIEGADALAERAQLFVPAAATASRGADRLHAVDWTTGEARAIELPIDPARSAREQIDALFKRARRLKEGGRIARARLAEAGASP